MSISYVQSNISGWPFPTGASTQSVSFLSNNTASNCIVVCITQANGILATFTVADTNGNTYTQVGTYAQYPSDLRQVAIFTTHNIIGGANTVNVSFNQTCGGNVVIAEYTGNAIVSPVENFASQVTTTSASVVTLTTSHPNDIVALYFYQSPSSTVSPPAGFTLRRATSGLGLAPNVAISDNSAYWDGVIVSPGTNTYTISGTSHAGHAECILFGLALTDGNLTSNSVVIMIDY
jgi:hypothetical protein